MTAVKLALSEKFQVKDLGELQYFLGVKDIQDHKNSVWIGQESYTENILRKFGMEDAKTVRTPVDTSRGGSRISEGVVLLFIIQNHTHFVKRHTQLQSNKKNKEEKRD